MSTLTVEQVGAVCGGEGDGLRLRLVGGDVGEVARRVRRVLAEMGMAWRPRRPEVAGGAGAVAGGDGGVRPRHRGVGERSEAGSREHARDNGKVVLVAGGVERADLHETRDPADRAHLVRGHDGLLLSARNPIAARVARPRMYPLSSMTSRGVAFDSAFDELHARQLRLAGIPGIGRGADDDCGPGGAVTAARMLEAAGMACRAAGGLRGVTEHRRAWAIPGPRSRRSGAAGAWLASHSAGGGRR